MARDIAHAKISERFEQTGVLPDYVKAIPFTSLAIVLCRHRAEDHPIYYAGPAKPRTWRIRATWPELGFAKDASWLCVGLFRADDSRPQKAQAAKACPGRSGECGLSLRDGHLRANVAAPWGLFGRLLCAQKEGVRRRRQP